MTILDLTLRGSTKPVEPVSSTFADAVVALACVSPSSPPPESPRSAGEVELASLTTRPSFFKNLQCKMPRHFCYPALAGFSTPPQMGQSLSRLIAFSIRLLDTKPRT